MSRPQQDRMYIAIDLKSFYASVECVERGLDPLKTNLVVADISRTEKTICLAVSPSLKAHGISGRARLFEVVQRTKEVNALRRLNAPGRKLTGESWKDDELKADPSLALSYIIAPPRMAEYMKWSARIYNIYLKYIAPEDIHVYSIDEVFMDVTQYLEIYGMTPAQLAGKIIRDVLAQTGITAAGGIAPQALMESPAFDGFLESWKGICPETGRKWNLYHGRCGKMFPGKAGRGPQRGTVVPAVWDQCRAFDRSRLGMGTLHDSGYQVL